MIRPVKPALIVAFVAIAALPAVAAPLVELVAPTPGTTLRGGSWALLSWRVDRPPIAEEWEAFLSTDGGAHYRFRITPHLDLTLRSVTWLVPNIDTTDARILIRVGNEREEQASELPMSFSIARDSRGELPLNTLRIEHGEPARDGDEGVIWWAQGDRGGTGARPVVTFVPPGAMESLRNVTLHDSAPAEAPKSSMLVEAPMRRVARVALHEDGNCRDLPHPAADILLLSHRQNI